MSIWWLHVANLQRCFERMAVAAHCVERPDRRRIYTRLREQSGLHLKRATERDEMHSALKTTGSGRLNCRSSFCSSIFRCSRQDLSYNLHHPNGMNLHGTFNFLVW